MALILHFKHIALKSAFHLHRPGAMGQGGDILEGLPRFDQGRKTGLFLSAIAMVHPHPGPGHPVDRMQHGKAAAVGLEIPCRAGRRLEIQRGFRQADHHIHIQPRPTRGIARRIADTTGGETQPRDLGRQSAPIAVAHQKGYGAHQLGFAQPQMAQIAALQRHRHRALRQPLPLRGRNFGAVKRAQIHHQPRTSSRVRSRAEA